MKEEYWLNTSFWNEPSDFWREIIINKLSSYTPTDILNVCSSQLQHTDMKDYTNLVHNYDNTGREDSPRYNRSRKNRYKCLELIPSTFKEMCEWMDRGTGDIVEYKRSEEKRGLYFGHLSTFEKIPAQCMIICIFCESVMKILEIPARLRVGFVKIKDEPIYYHHNELQYFYGDKWILEDPTNFQKKLRRGAGFKIVDELEGLIEKDFIYSFEAARLIKDDQELLNRFSSPSGKSKGYYLLAKTLADDLFALRNEPAVPWKIEYLYKNKVIKNDESAEEAFLSLQHDLHDVLVREPYPEKVKVVGRDSIDYRLKSV